MTCLACVAAAFAIVGIVCRLMPEMHLEKRYNWLRSARGIASLSVLLGAAITLATVFQLRDLNVDILSESAVATLLEAGLLLFMALGSWSVTVVSMKRCERKLKLRERIPSALAQPDLQKPKFSIEIKARGEGLEYKDEDGTFNFNICLRSRPIQVHAYECSDESFDPRSLTAAQQSRIFPRIVAYLDPWRGKVQILTEAPDQPLRSVDDIMRERFKQRLANGGQG